ncbi:MAG TPA: phosphate ABC transporter substrate-binding protein [Acidobacteria bacterium]|nr:phosphate ABC transporter substrate-binding protein [Acidobacteriota bacterium]
MTMTRSLRSTPFLLAALLCGALAFGPAAPARAAEGYKVVVHPANPAATVARELLARYFLKKATTWPSGKGVTPADQSKDAAVRQAFSRDVLKKSAAEVSAYWQQQIFSGRAVPPVEKAGDAAVVAFVAGHEGAVGYVSAGADTPGVKVVQVVD